MKQVEKKSKTRSSKITHMLSIKNS